MRKNVKRTIQILATRNDGIEQQRGVFAPVIAANLRMVDLRLRKAGLAELSGLLLADEVQWIEHKDASDTFYAAWQFFEKNPESIPFSDILIKTLSGIVQAIVTIRDDSQVRFAFVEIGHDGLDHGSHVNLDA